MNAELPNPNPGPFAVRPRSEAGGAGGAAAGNQPAHLNVERVGAVQRTAAAALVLAHSQRHLPEQELENQQNLLFQVFADSPNLVYVEDAVEKARLPVFEFALLRLLFQRLERYFCYLLLLQQKLKAQSILHNECPNIHHFCPHPKKSLLQLHLLLAQSIRWS